MKFLAIWGFQKPGGKKIGEEREGFAQSEGKLAGKNHWRMFRRLTERGRGVTRGLFFILVERQEHFYKVLSKKS